MEKMFEASGSSSSAPVAPRPAYMAATSMVDERAKEYLSGIPHSTPPNLKFEEEEMAERNSARLQEAAEWLHTEKTRVSINIEQLVEIITQSCARARHKG